MLLLPNGRRRERSITRPTFNRLIASQVSVIPDVVYPYDPVVVRWIQREFDPNFVPVFVKNIFRTQAGGEFVEFHHAAAASTNQSFRDGPVELFTYRSLQPTYGAGRTRRPTRMHLHFYHRDPKSGKPVKGTFVPFEWNVYWFLISCRDTMSRQERDGKRREQQAHSSEAVAARKRAEADERAEYMERQDGNWLGRMRDEFDVTDKNRIVAKGMSYDPNPATRPSVYVSQKHRKELVV